MLGSMINRFRSGQSVPDPVRDPALAQLVPDLEDPNEIRRQLAAVEARRDADDARWEAIDRQPSNPRAFLEQQTIAERRPHLQAQIDALRPRIPAAETRRAAFFELARVLAQTDETIAMQAEEMYAHVLDSTAAERRDRFEALAGQLRLRGRLAAALAAVSRAPRFHRRELDPFAVLRSDLRDRVTEIEHFRMPGGVKPPVPWPPRVRQLIDVLAGKGA